MSFRKGDIIGDYTLKDFLGEGTTAQVWAGIKEGENESVALKIFNHTNDLGEIEALKEEYGGTVHLEHNHIVTPDTLFEHNDQQVIVMKLCSRSLWQELNMRQSRSTTKEYFTERELAKVLSDVTAALVYLHFEPKLIGDNTREEIVIHNDIKPGNILMNDDGDLGVYYLTDFGIVRNIIYTIPKNKIQNIGLTYAYAPPERFESKPTIHVNSDIFSLGASIYELTNGIGDIPLAQLINHNKKIPPLEGSYTSRFKQLIAAMLSEDPYDRPDARVIYKLATDYLSGEGWGTIHGFEAGKDGEDKHEGSCPKCHYPLTNDNTSCPNCTEPIPCKKCDKPLNEDGLCANCNIICDICGSNYDSALSNCPTCPESIYCSACGSELQYEGAPCSVCSPIYLCKKCQSPLSSEFAKCENCSSSMGFLKILIPLMLLALVGFFTKDFILSKSDTVNHTQYFDSISQFSKDGFACVLKDGKAGVIDSDNNLVEDLMYTRCVCTNGEITLYVNDKKTKFEPTKMK